MKTTLLSRSFALGAALAATTFAGPTAGPPLQEWDQVVALMGIPRVELARQLADLRTDRPTRRAIPVALAFRAGFDQLAALATATRKDPDPLVRESAIASLGYLGLLLRRLGDQVPGIGSDHLARITGALTTCLSDRDRRVRATAASTLAAIGVATSAGFEPLVDLLQDTEESIVQEAALALGSFHGRLAEATAKLRPLLGDRREVVRVSAAAALLRLGVDEDLVREPLAAGLASSRPDAREAATAALALFEGPGIIPELWRLLNDPIPAVRVAACQALATRGPAARITRARLARMLHHDRYPSVRAAAALALPAVAGEEAVAPLVQALDQNRGEVGAWAALSLASHGLSGQEALREVQATGTPRARANASFALSFQGD